MHRDGHTVTSSTPGRRNAEREADCGTRRTAPHRAEGLPSPATVAARRLALVADRAARALGTLTVKRTLDLVLGSTLLLLAAPALTLGALALALRAPPAEGAAGAAY